MLKPLFIEQVSHLNRRSSNESFKETRPIVHLGKYTATKTDEFSENQVKAKMPVYVESTKMLPNAEFSCRHWKQKCSCRPWKASWRWTHLITADSSIQLDRIQCNIKWKHANSSLELCGTEATPLRWQEVLKFSAAVHWALVARPLEL